MGPSNCAVVKCFNTSKKLKDFCEKQCGVHAGLLKGSCGCPQPYRLYMFPFIKRNHEKRQAWIKLLKRVKADKSEWKPCGNDRVCSEHFVDGIPTVENPNPTLKLGYDLNKAKPRRTLFKEPIPKKTKKTLSVCDSNALSTSSASSSSHADNVNISSVEGSFMSDLQHHLNFHTSCRQCLQNITILCQVFQCIINVNHVIIKTH